MKHLSLPSYAKINIGLLIKGKRQDGFHEIETVLKQISLKDTLELTLSSNQEIMIECSHPDVPEDQANLCARAALLLRKIGDVSSGGVHIRLTKNIPVGAGLGGGSSNAAVTLLGLNKLWKLKFSAAELEGFASEIGSDVPFFIKGGTARATGKGEILNQTTFSINHPLVVVYPKITISTKWAYKQINLDLTNTKKNITLPHFEGSVYGNNAFPSSFKNDFEEFIFLEYPLLEEIKSQMDRGGALFSSLSGSGSAIYGIFREYNQAENMTKIFQQSYLTYITRETEWGYKDI